MSSKCHHCGTWHPPSSPCIPNPVAWTVSAPEKVERETEGTSIKALQKNIAEWADTVFPNRTAHGALCKLMLEEVPEFALDQHSPSEYADLVILILDIGTLNGIDVERAVLDKMETNRKRRWTINKDTGIMRHTE